MCVFTAALIVFTLGEKKLCPFPVISRICSGPLCKFVDRDHCQQSVYVEGMHGCFRYKLPLHLNQHCLLQQQKGASLPHQNFLKLA